MDTAAENGAMGAVRVNVLANSCLFTHLADILLMLTPLLSFSYCVLPWKMLTHSLILPKIKHLLKKIWSSKSFWTKCQGDSVTGKSFDISLRISALSAERKEFPTLHTKTQSIINVIATF